MKLVFLCVCSFAILNFINVSIKVVAILSLVMFIKGISTNLMVLPAHSFAETGYMYHFTEFFNINSLKHP